MVDVQLATGYFNYILSTATRLLMQIYYSDGKTMETIRVFNFTGSYVLINLTPSTSYRIHVRAVKLIGINNETLESTSSMTITITTLGKEYMHATIRS